MKLVVAGCLVIMGVAACGPMYGSPSEPLGKPKVIVDKTKKPPPPPTPPPAPVYVDKCVTDFHRPAIKVPKTATQTASRLAQTGDGQVAAATNEPAEPKKLALAKVGLETLSDALKSDPYHADATLLLAVTYDTVHRKGCALRLLERLAVMQNNPKFADDAKRAALRVKGNEDWFKDYREQALKAAAVP